MASAREAVSADLVDLDLYAAQAGTTYVLSDVHGRTREVDVPADLPFPLALGLVRAYDEFMAAMDLEVPDEAQARRAFRRLCQILSGIGSLVSPGPKAHELMSAYGQERVIIWANVLITRIQLAQSGMSLERWLAKLFEEVEIDPKAAGSAISSVVSGLITDGPPTTGEGSDGPSSGATSPTSRLPR